MATLTVRNLHPDVIARLKELAARNNRSMEQEVRRLLEAVSLDRGAACRRIEESWVRQRRATSADEVDEWVRRSRP